MHPRGGTELQMEMLYKHCPKELLETSIKKSINLFIGILILEV